MRRPARGAVAERTAPQNPAAKLGQFYSDPLKLRRGFPLVEICLLHYRDRNSRRARGCCCASHRRAVSRVIGSAKRCAASTDAARSGEASIPASAKRGCQRHTVGRLTPTLCATRCAEPRSAEASTMRARSTCLRGRLRSATITANPLPFRSAENHTNRLSHAHPPKMGTVLHILTIL